MAGSMISGLKETQRKCFPYPRVIYPPVTFTVAFYLLVAPMMKTFFLLLIPSISVRIWLMTLSAAPPASPAPPPRALAMESSSSKNRMHGAACRAYYHNNKNNSDREWILDCVVSQVNGVEKVCVQNYIWIGHKHKKLYIMWSILTAHLIKHVSHVCLWFAKPHGEHFWACDQQKTWNGLQIHTCVQHVLFVTLLFHTHTFNRHKVCLALVGNGFS